jgi:phosphate starvation-inducible protein PhoH and related proteins
MSTNNVENVVDAVASHNFREKRKPKNPIKFNVTLDQDQKQAKSLVLQNTITVLTGAAGSGKTMVACQAGLDLLFNKEIEKIIVARPVVTAREEIGFLPGGLKDKLDPFIAPIYDNMYRLYNKEKIDKEFAEGRIEIIPFAFMRGRNFSNAFIILDEAQNVTDNQMELAITRLCAGSKMCIVGDVSQIDLKQKKDSGLYFVSKAVASAVEGVAHFHLKTNHRHSIVEPILEIYKTLRE